MIDFPGDNKKAELFFSLFMQNQRRIHAYILMLVHNRTDADDIMQETAAIMWTKFDTFKPESSFAAWGIGVARNKVLRFRRDFQRSRIQFNDEVFEQLTDKASQFQDDKDEYIDIVNDCVAKLNEDDQQIIKLRYTNSLTIKSIAGHMGRSTQGIYKTMARIHSVLQECTQRTIASLGRAK